MMPIVMINIAVDMSSVSPRKGHGHKPVIMDTGPTAGIYVSDENNHDEQINHLVT